MESKTITFGLGEKRSMNVEAIVVYSFTKNAHQGNPAGVVLNPKMLNERQMMRVSDILQVSETAFLFPGESTDYTIRFFSPTIEVDLCGHATIAAFTVIGKKYEEKRKKTIKFTQKTLTGILSVSCFYDKDFCLDYVMMEQQKPLFESVNYDYSTIAEALNIGNEQLIKDLPQQRVSTGLFTLPICVDSYKTLKTMQPDFKRVEKLCRKLSIGSIHVFTFDTLDDFSLYHARNFAPCYGVNEDPVTGTANGAVCAYLKKNNHLIKFPVICEQGDVIGQPGRVRVDITDKIVWVGGHAVIGSSQMITV